jgi:hypothetical protein
MADKTWTAVDLRMDRLSIAREGSELVIERRYAFLDAEGAELTQIAPGRLVRRVALAEVPAGVLSALQALDTYTKNQALQQEGMS